MSLPATNFSRSTTFELSTSKRLQLLVGEGEELAAAVFVSFDDLALLDLLAGSRIMRAERDAGGCGDLLSVHLVAEERASVGVRRTSPRRRSLRRFAAFRHRPRRAGEQIDHFGVAHLVEIAIVEAD